MTIYYLIIFLSLIACMLLYIKWAERLGILDNPNSRSSHIRPTIRGGGIIIVLAVIIWAIIFDTNNYLLTTSIILIAIIGFLDDCYSISQFPRLIVQSISVLLLLIHIGNGVELTILLMVYFILITGWLNTFNFMDGINGITVLYSISVLIGFLLFQDKATEISVSFIYVILIALIVFGYFNVRKKAIIFAGDVGSLSLGLILAYLVFTLMLQDDKWEYIIFLSVYGVDSVLTILYRLLNKENIFEAHRSHLYQYLANEMNYHHISVAAGYSMVQFMIILGLSYLPYRVWGIYAITILIILCVLYMIIKKYILNVISSE